MPTLDYNTLVVVAGTLLLGLASGVVGSLTVLRGRALLGDALSHATLPGICLAFLLFERREFSILLLGALVSGLVGVAVVALIPRFTRIKEDAATGIVLSVFFGAGIALSSYIQRATVDGAQAGIDGFLLGKTAGMLFSDVVTIAMASAAVLITVALLYKELKLICFDRDFAAVEGWPVLGLDLLVLLLLAVTTVVGLPAVGVVLMVAMLILPAAAARFWVGGFGALLSLAGVLGLLTGATGSLISAHSTRLPAGPIIVLVGSGIFLLSMLIAPRRGLVARLWRQRQLRTRRLIQRTLLALLPGRGSEPPPRRTTAISRHLAAPNRFVGRVLRRLAQEGFVSQDDAGWHLSPRGEERARGMRRTHDLWKLYLLSAADIDRDLVDPDVEMIEKILPPETVRLLEEELARASTDPEVVT